MRVLRGEVAVVCDRQPDLAVDDAQQRLAQGQRQQRKQGHRRTGTAQPRA